MATSSRNRGMTQPDSAQPGGAQQDTPAWRCRAGQNHSTRRCPGGSIAYMRQEEMPALPAELQPFMRDGRLARIPVKRGKRLLLLNCLSQSFEPGRRYTEAEVNAVLRTVHDDYAALRRYLVDEDFLSREDGIYWRTGGTVEI
jgi:hypothetical protein